MSDRIVTVFLSSTARDLSQHRKAVIERMRRLDRTHCDAMEYFGARDVGAVQFCRQRVAAADVYVGLIGHHRGWEPDGDNARRSITELEHDWAVEAGTSCLLFVAPDAGYLPADIQLPDMTADEVARQDRFRKRAMVHVVEQEFGTPEVLAANVLAAVANFRIRQVLAAQSLLAQSPSRTQPRSWWGWFAGTSKPTGRAPDRAKASATPEETVAAPSSPVPNVQAGSSTLPAALADLAADPEFAPLFANPATFDIRKVEAALANRAQRQTGDGKAQLRAAAADWQRIGELAEWHDVERAVGAYRRAAETDPADPRHWMRLGRMEQTAGRLTEARRAFSQAFTAAEAAGSERDLAAASTFLGDVLVAQGNLADALQAFQAGRAIAARLAAESPDDADRQRDLSVSQEKIGDVLSAQGNLPAALDAFNTSLRLRERLAKADPASLGEHGSAMTLGWQRDLSVSQNKIGDVLVAQGNLPAALDAFNASLRLRERLAKADPGNAGWQRDLSVSQNKIGDVLVAQGNLPEALDAFNASHAIFERLAKADPGNAKWQADLAMSNERIGDMHREQGKQVGAIAAFERSLTAYSNVLARHPNNVQIEVFSVVPHMRLADLKGKAGRPHLVAALAILKPLAAENRLDAMRIAWIPGLEAKLRDMDGT